jgi:hypothetical protein
MSAANKPNAQKGATPAESWLQMRITRPRKAAYVRTASRGGEKLTAWAQRHLDRAADYTEQEQPPANPAA